MMSGPVRAELGLPPTPKNGDELSGIPANLDQTYSAVKVAQARLMQTAAELGSFHSFGESPDRDARRVLQARLVRQYRYDLG